MRRVISQSARTIPRWRRWSNWATELQVRQFAGNCCCASNVLLYDHIVTVSGQGAHCAQLTTRQWLGDKAPEQLLGLPSWFFQGCTKGNANGLFNLLGSQSQFVFSRCRRHVMMLARKYCMKQSTIDGKRASEPTRDGCCRLWQTYTENRTLSQGLAPLGQKMKSEQSTERAD